MLAFNWLKNGVLSPLKLRIDSTVVKSNIAPPSDSQILNDGARVLSRLLAIQIFNAKRLERKRFTCTYLSWSTT